MVGTQEQSEGVGVGVEVAGGMWGFGTPVLPPCLCPPSPQLRHLCSYNLGVFHELWLLHCQHIHSLLSMASISANSFLWLLGSSHSWHSSIPVTCVAMVLHDQCVKLQDKADSPQLAITICG